MFVQCAVPWPREGLCANDTVMDERCGHVSGGVCACGTVTSPKDAQEMNVIASLESGQREGRESPAVVSRVKRTDCPPLNFSNWS